jgi:uncharacterized protein (DUF1501 family)
MSAGPGARRADGGALTRRAFLHAGLAGGAILAGLPVFLRPSRAGASPSASGRTPLLVVVFLRGGADGLALVPPIGDAALTRARGPLLAGVPIPIGGSGAEFGLHPGFASLAPVLTRGQLAVVHAVGWPEPVRSHFEAQDLCERAGARPGAAVEGWLARVLAASGEAPAAFRAVAASPARPRALAGDPRAIAVERIDALRLPATGPAVSRALASVWSGADGDAPGSLLARAGQEGLEALATLRTRAGSLVLPGEGAFPNTPLGTRLATVAKLARADLGLVAAWVDAWGWDTHVAQGAEDGALARSIRDLAQGLAALLAALEDRSDELLVLVVTEFGRTAAVNGSGGTDHGRGGAALALGGRVRGGRVLGRWPGTVRDALEDGRDLRVTTDVRAVLAEGARHLGAGDPRLFPGLAAPGLGLLGA